mgnify:CR=1 FL=1
MSTTHARPPCAARGGAALIGHRTSVAQRIKRTRSHRPRPPAGPPKSPLAPLRVLTRRSFHAGSCLPSGSHISPHRRHRRPACTTSSKLGRMGVRRFWKGSRTPPRRGMPSRACDARRDAGAVEFATKCVSAQGGVVKQPRRSVCSSLLPHPASPRRGHATWCCPHCRHSSTEYPLLMKMQL